MWFLKRKIQFVLLSIALLGHALPALSGTTIHDVTFSSNTASLLTNSQNTRLELFAMGQDMVLHLTPSRLNAIALKHSAPSTALTLFEGTIEGEPDSWVRLSVMQSDSTEKLNGQLFYNGSLYQLENQDYLHTIGVDHASTSEHVLLQTQNNASGQDLLQGYLPPQDLIQFAPPSSFRQRSIFDTPAFDKPSFTTRADEIGADEYGPLVSKALRVGIYVDSRFNEAHQGRGLARALSIMSGVDAIYQAQLGVAVIVESISFNDDPETDPMRYKSGNVGQILEDFRLVRQADTALPADLSMVHLFTGHRDPERTIGLGWKSTTCRIDGFDISVSTVFPFDTLLAAHELAHNLGAVHDDDLRCAAQPIAQENALMWPSISGSSTSVFSSCSIAFMQVAKDESCNANSIDAAVKIYSTPVDDGNGLGENFQRSVIVKVSNQDPLGRPTELFSTTEFPVGTVFNNIAAGCFVNNSNIDCDHGTVAAFSDSSIRLTATLLDNGNETVVSNVELLNAVDVRTHNNRTAISVLQDQVSLDQPIFADTIRMQDSTSSSSNDVISKLGMPSWWTLLMLSGLFGFRVRSNKFAN